jgi:superfamily I DNA/RNA helicase
MRARNAVDFDDLLLLSTALLQRDADARAKYAAPPPISRPYLPHTSPISPYISPISPRYQQTWSHVLVDEFQAPIHN